MAAEVARCPYSGRGIGGNAHDYNLALTQVPDLITELTNSAARQSEASLVRTIDPDCMKKVWSHVLANSFGPPPETSGNSDEDEENGQNNLRCSVASINTAVNFANTCNFCKLSYRDQKTELDAETVVTKVGEEAKNGESDGNYYKQRFLISKIKGGLWLPLKAEGSETWILIYRNRDTRCMKAYNKVVCCFATIVSENAYNCVEICLDDAMVLFSGHDLKKALWNHDDLTVKRRSTKGGGKLINTYFDDAVDSEFHKNIHDENDLINDTVEFSYYLSVTSDFFNKRLVIKTGSTTAACWNDRCFTLEPIELRKFATAMGADDIVDVAICRGAGEAGALSSLTKAMHAFLISGAPLRRTASLSALLASLSSSSVTVISRSSYVSSLRSGIFTLPFASTLDLPCARRTAVPSLSQPPRPSQAGTSTQHTAAHTHAGAHLGIEELSLPVEGDLKLVQRELLLLPRLHGDVARHLLHFAHLAATGAVVEDHNVAEQLCQALLGPLGQVLLRPVPAVDVSSILPFLDDPTLITLADLRHVSWRWTSRVHNLRG